MTEWEWLNCDDPRPLVRWLDARADDRKVRLFGCHCCRRLWRALDEGRRRAVRASEWYAEGRLSAATWGRIGASLSPAVTAADEAAWAAWRGYGIVAAWRAAEAVEDAAPPRRRLAAWQAERAWQAALLRELCGNPFHPPTPPPAAVLGWNDGLVLRLARAIYDRRRWDDLPILADALLDAGCDDEALIEHCRAAGFHVRGCFALDAILGRTPAGVPARSRSYQHLS